MGLDGELSGLRLIETIPRRGWAPQAVGILQDRTQEMHLGRMAKSAEALGWSFNRGEAERVLRECREERARLRLTMDRDGDFVLETGPLPDPGGPWRVAVHSTRLRSDDPWLRHKTTNRRLYDEARAALPLGIDEWIFLNERDEVCEGTITNVFFLRREAGRWRTPPLACGCLPGIYRKTCLATGGAVEEVLMVEDLPRVRLALGNSLRQRIEAVLV